MVFMPVVIPLLEKAGSSRQAYNRIDMLLKLASLLLALLSREALLLLVMVQQYALRRFILMVIGSGGQTHP